MVEPMYQCVMQCTVMVHYQVHTACWVPVAVVQVSVCPCEATAECTMSPIGSCDCPCHRLLATAQFYSNSHIHVVG
jgi:hypothetical protein